MLWRKSIRPPSSAYTIFFSGKFYKLNHSIAIFWGYLKIIRKIFVKKQQKPTHPPLAIHQMFQCFVISLLKWMKYKNRLISAYYSITLWDFKSSKCSKNLASVKSKKEIFKNISNYRNTAYYDFESRFFAIFSSNYRHRLVLKIPFPDHIFPKISKYRTENLHFSFTGKYYAPLPLFSWTYLLKKTPWRTKILISSVWNKILKTWDNF